MNIRKIIREELEGDWSWAEEIPETVRIGDVFHTRTLYTPTERGHETFEIYDISPDYKWVRFSHHDTRGIWSSGERKKPYIPIDEINRETLSKDWDKAGYNGANSTPIEQVIKNINSGFWKRVDTPGHMDDHPEDLNKLIKLGEEDWTWVEDERGYGSWVKDLNESQEWDWSDDTTPEMGFLSTVINQSTIRVWSDLNFDSVFFIPNDGKNIVVVSTNFEYTMWDGEATHEELIGHFLEHANVEFYSDMEQIDELIDMSK
jgi:hypothetical protein